jgi:hypothetical protein
MRFTPRSDRAVTVSPAPKFMPLPVRNVIEASTSFLKKRSKKLLLLRLRGRSRTDEWVTILRTKSFLVLFFKKELLPSFRINIDDAVAVWRSQVMAETRT